MFSSWSIPRCITVAFALVLACLLALAGYSVVTLRQVVASEELRSHSAVVAKALTAGAYAEMLKTRISLILDVTQQRPGAREDGMRHLQNVRQKIAALNALILQYPSLQPLQADAAAAQTDLAAYDDNVRQGFQLTDAKVTSGEAWEQRFSEGRRLGALAVDDCDRLQAHASQITQRIMDRDLATLRDTSVHDSIVCAVCLLLSIPTAFAVVRRVRRSLHGITCDLEGATGQIAGSAHHLAASSETLAQSAVSQAATIQQTSAASTQIHALTRATTENSISAAAIVAQSQTGFAQANESLDHMATAMRQIDESSHKVSKIIRIIDDIAFQTNILALNAAVEAARAGDAGMGFAVVAEEVRHLAQRSAQAAKDTTALIEESLAKSSSGRDTVAQVAAAIHTVTQESERIRNLIDEIKTQGIEQAKGIEQIGQAIVHMEKAAQNSAVQAEQGSHASAQLNRQADAMNGVIDRLKHMVEGSTLSVR